MNSSNNNSNVNDRNKDNTQKCGECRKKIVPSTNNKCIRCRKPLCNTCYELSMSRHLNNSFYKQYINYCDACIWFDMG